MSEEIIKVKKDDPRRCQGSNKYGQCLNRAVEGGTVCIVHGGNKQLDSIANKEANNYRIEKYANRIQEKKDSPDVKSLRDEIAILRILLEERLNRYGDDILTYAGPISDMIMKIEKIVVSCHKLESNMGLHLDKTAVLQFVNTIITILTTRIEDPVLLKIISSEIQAALFDNPGDTE